MTWAILASGDDDAVAERDRARGHETGVQRTESGPRVGDRVIREDLAVEARMLFAKLRDTSRVGAGVAAEHEDVR